MTIDTSTAKCDTCGKPYVPGDAVYSIADQFNGDVLTSFRHWDCHVPINVAFDQLREKLAEAKNTLNKLRDLPKR